MKTGLGENLEAIRQKGIAKLREELDTLLVTLEAKDARLAELVDFVCSPKFYAPGRIRRDELVRAFLTSTIPRDKVLVRREDLDWLWIMAHGAQALITMGKNSPDMDKYNRLHTALGDKP